MQAGQQRPSYDELADLVAAQARVIEQLRVEVAELRTDNERLRAENAELTRRLGMNSTNSFWWFGPREAAKKFFAS